MISSPTIFSIFNERGRIISILSSYRILLEDETCLFYLEEGEGDLFALEVSKQVIEQSQGFVEHFAQQTIPFISELLEGNLIFLEHLSKQTIIFPFAFDPTRHYHIIFLASQPCRLNKLQKTELFHLPLLSQKELTMHLNTWISLFSFLFPPAPLNSSPNRIQPNQIESFPQDEIISFLSSPPDQQKQEISWIKICRGTLNLFGMEKLILENDKAFYPGNDQIWFKSNSEIEIQILEQANIYSSSLSWQGISFILQGILNLFTLKCQKDEQELKQKIFLSQELENIQLLHSIRELETVLNENQQVFRKNTSNILYETCQLIGEKMNLNFILPSNKRKINQVKDSLYQICFHSNVFYREVTLTKRWWHRQLGPFLGLYGEQLTPVALIPADNLNYQMINLENNSHQIIDETISSQLAPWAYMFYRALPNKDKITIHDLVRFSFYNQKKNLFRIFISVALSASLALFFPFLNSIIFNLIIPNFDTPLLLQVTSGLLIIAISTTCFNFIKEYTFAYLEGLLEHNLEVGVWQRIFNLPLDFFRQFEVGDLIIRSFTIQTVFQRLTGSTLRTILNGFYGFLFLFPMFYYSPLLTLVVLCVILVGLFFSGWSIIQSLKYNPRIVELTGKLNGLILQVLSGISKIRIVGGENTAFILWEKFFFQIKKMQFSVLKINNRTGAVNYLILNLSLLSLYAAAILLMQSDSTFHLDIGNFIAFMAAFTPFTLSTIELVGTLVGVIDVIALWKWGQVILKEKPESNFLKLDPEELTGNIKVEHVSYRYNKNDPFVLEDVSIYADPGEFIAIIGASGGGKSSLVRLLVGFETPETGAIYYDHKDLTTLDLRQVRQQIGIVLQTSLILDGTIRDNIVCSGFYTDEEIKHALTLSGFEEDLKRLPMGLETMLSNKGSTFSGGQRQRLLIARALVSQPKILIFDEATSALDSKTQDIVSRNLEQLKMTRIIVAHRLSTIKKADRIYMIDKGKITAIGTFEELMAQGKLFK